MPTRSAGLLPFRLTSDGTLELFLVHPGGPYWARKDKRSWSIAKGEYGDGEAALAAAEREFTEEIGCSPPSGRRIDLGQVRQTGGKVVRAWAIEAAQFTVTEVASNELNSSGLLIRDATNRSLKWTELNGCRRPSPDGGLSGPNSPSSTGWRSRFRSIPRRRRRTVLEVARLADSKFRVGPWPDQRRCSVDLDGNVRSTVEHRQIVPSRESVGGCVSCVGTPRVLRAEDCIDCRLATGCKT